MKKIKLPAKHARAALGVAVEQRRQVAEGLRSFGLHLAEALGVDPRLGAAVMLQAVVELREDRERLAALAGEEPLRRFVPDGPLVGEPLAVVARPVR